MQVPLDTNQSFVQRVSRRSDVVVTSLLHIPDVRGHVEVLAFEERYHRGMVLRAVAGVSGGHLG